MGERVRFFVRDGLSVDPCMAGGTPHVKGMVHELCFCQLPVALETVYAPS